VPPNQQLIVTAVSAAIAILVFELVRKRKLREDYSLLWMMFAAGLLALAFTPFDWLVHLANAFGSERPTATIFFLGFVFMTLICLQFSVRLSRMTGDVKNLAQKIALLEAERDEPKGGG
jgi:hypothetical protein